jgi:Txe/YoeB family toxin of toxin-antitoxin system
MKDFNKLKQAGAAYIRKIKELVDIVAENPYKNPPQYEKLAGELLGYYSRRINEQHRFIYEILPNTKNILHENGTPYIGVIHVLKMWTHYE